MLQTVIGTAVIILVYLCLFIIVFSPTIYALWIYLIGRKVTGKKKGMFQAVATVLCVNLIVAYFLIHLSFDYFLVNKLSQKDAMAVKTLRSAVASQKKFHASHGRYYSVGPVRGPYRDEHGLTIDKDLIVQVTPTWKGKEKRVDSFRAHAIHVWGQGAAVSTGKGDVTLHPPDSQEAARVRAKLLRSVK
jgi:hypothetical protein